MTHDASSESDSLIDTTGIRTRRNLLVSGAGAAAAFGLTSLAIAAPTPEPSVDSPKRNRSSLANASSELVLEDGTTLFYKDWGSGRPIVFSHGWPLSADAWDAQLLFFGEHGFRVIAHDRRGHGRSTQTWNGNDMDTYADDLSALMDHLDVKNAVMVGHSTGGGEVVRTIARHGARRVSKAVLVGAVPPWMAKSAANPGGAPMEIFDQLRAGVRGDHAQLYRDLSAPFFGTNRAGAKPLQGLRDAFWQQAMLGGHKSLYDCIKAFSETNFTSDLAKIDLPTLVVHGEDDQIVPLQLSSAITAKLLKRATLKIYPGAPHGLTMTHQDQFNEDVLAFLRS